MSREEIFEQIRSTLVEHFEVPESDVTLEATLIEDLGLDSIDAIDMAVRIQEMTGVRVEEEQLRELRTVSDTVDLIERLGSSAGSAGSAESAESASSA